MGRPRPRETRREEATGRAAGGPGGARAAAGRSQALQAFFIANTGRGLLPAGETSGVLSPNLKTEET
jgi:type IV secretion system protein TrbL